MDQSTSHNGPISLMLAGEKEKQEIGLLWELITGCEIPGLYTEEDLIDKCIRQKLREEKPLNFVGVDLSSLSYGTTAFVGPGLLQFFLPFCSVGSHPPPGTHFQYFVPCS